MYCVKGKFRRALSRFSLSRARKEAALSPAVYSSDNCVCRANIFTWFARGRPLVPLPRSIKMHSSACVMHLAAVLYAERIALFSVGKRTRFAFTRREKYFVYLARLLRRKIMRHITTQKVFTRKQHRRFPRSIARYCVRAN